MHSLRALRRSRATALVTVLAAAASLLASACSPDGPRDAAARPAAGSLGHVSTTLAALPRAIPSALAPYYGQTLDWHACPDGAPGLECTKLRVPLDYAHPVAGGSIRLAVARKKATSPAKRLGSLQVNPGGPGASAIEFLTDFAGTGYPAAVRARYDIVAVDPRGVGRSHPVRCLTDPQMEAHTQVDQTPDSPREVRALTRAYDTFAAGCRKSAGKLLGHVSTVEAARDMDVLRAALGDRKLAYVGASYGTLLGATYAGLFPERTGRLVLDGAMDPSLTSLQLNRDQNTGFTLAFNAFAKDCVARKDCPLGHESPADASERLSAFLRRLDRHPLPTGESRRLSEPLATMGVLQAMYLKDFWGPLRDGLRRALTKRDGGDLLQLADIYYERQPDGSYGDMMSGFTAVSCLDQAPPFRTPADVEKQVGAFEKDSPVFGRDFAWAALNCGDWPVHPTGRANRIRAKGAPPIVVVGTTRDPATPYVWARSLAAQLDKGVLLTHDGDGHTAYARGNRCVDGAVNRYLLEGRPPPEGTRCG